MPQCVIHEFIEICSLHFELQIVCNVNIFKFHRLHSLNQHLLYDVRSTISSYSIVFAAPMSETVL